MAFAHSKNTRVFLNEMHVSAQVTGWSIGHSRQYSPVTVILDSGARWLPGLLSGSIAVKGLFDSSAGTLSTEIATASGVDNGALWTVPVDGLTIGSPALMAASDLENYSVEATVTDAVSLAIDATPDDGVDMGVLLADHSAITVDTNNTSVDNTASSSGGGVATLHVTAYSGLTSAVVKVQHSSNNSTWADLITFTTVTAVTSERLTVTGTVNRYVRAIFDVTGTGSVTAAVAFARR